VILASIIPHSELDHLLSTWGYPAIFLFVGAESLGVPIPGETMLILAALYAGSTHKLSVEGVVATAAAAAIIGDNIGYLIGRVGGYRLLRRYGKYVRIDERRLKIGRYLFDHHGGKVVFFGRFVSVLRTYAAFLAGTNEMHWATFLVWNASGGIVWATIFGVGYYAFGSTLNHLQGGIDIVLGVAAVIGVVAGIWYLRRKERELGEKAEAAYPD
jgi:membrane protein DedA with SNARE-associated domain